MLNKTRIDLTFQRMFVLGDNTAFLS